MTDAETDASQSSVAQRKILAEIDLAQFQAKTERLRLQYAWRKFLVTSLVVGALGTICSYILKWGQLQSQILEQDNAHLARYVEYATDETPFIRLRLATYFMYLSGSEDSRRRWAQYHTVVQSEYNEKRNLLTQLEQQQDLTDEQQREIVRLRGELTRSRTDAFRAPACDDNEDNDGDGRVDYPIDPGCSSYADDDESDEAGRRRD